MAAMAMIAATVPAAACARDISLGEVEQQVLRANREVQAARRGVESAGAQVMQADVRPNPVVSLNTLNISSNPGVGPGSLGSKRVDSVFRVDQTLERGNKRELRIDAAQGLERAARGDALDVLRQQLLAARAAYADLQEAQQKADILEGTAQLLARALSVAQLRLKAGDIAAAEVSRVQVDAERAQNDLRAAQAERRRLAPEPADSIAQGRPSKRNRRELDAWRQPPAEWNDRWSASIDDE